MRIIVTLLTLVAALRGEGDSRDREVIVRFKSGAASRLGASMADHDISAVKRLSGAGYLMKSRSKTVDKMISRLRQDSDVDFAEPNYIIRSDRRPDDPQFGLQWGLQNTGQSVLGAPGAANADIGMSTAWNYNTGNRNFVVGVVDTGIDYNHPDLVGNVWSSSRAFTLNLNGFTIICPAGSHGYNAILNSCDPMDDHNHGTFVSGTIGATGNNGVGVAGVNWSTSVMALKVLREDATGTIADAVEALEFARQVKLQGIADIRVLNISWNYVGPPSQILLDQLRALTEAGILVVASAGNKASDLESTPAYPASYNLDRLVSVAASSDSDQLASFSNYGAISVDLVAPGVNVFSTVRNGYDFWSGASVAAPHVSGAAMLVWSACPTLTVAQIKIALLSTVDKVPSLTGKVATGGRLNVARAIRSCVPTPPQPISVTPASANGSATTIAVKTTDDNGVTDIKRIDLLVAQEQSYGGVYCHLSYNVATRVASLRSNDGSWAAASTGSLGNGVCSVDVARLTQSVDESALTVTFPVELYGWMGLQNVYIRVYDAASLDSGWVKEGLWTISNVPPVLTGLSPGNGVGTVAVFSIDASDGNGSGDVARVDLSIGPSPSLAGQTCHVVYLLKSRTVSLQTNEGTWDSRTAGSPGVLSNTRCSLDAADFSFSATGSTVRANVPLQFASSWTGPKDVSARVFDATGLSSNWAKVGVWTVGNAPPVLLAVIPGSGRGLAATFALRAADANGLADIKRIDLFVGQTPSYLGRNCHVVYDLKTALVSLRLENGTWLSGTAGSSGVLSGSSCSVDKAGVSFSTVNGLVSANFPVMFPASWSGTQTVFGRVYDIDNSDSSWRQAGQWTVGTEPVPPVVVSVTPGVGTGTMAALAVRISDGNGPVEIRRVDLFVGQLPSLPGANCQATFDLATGMISLQSDGSTAVAGIAGTTGVLVNHRCSVDKASVSFRSLENDVVAKIPLRFSDSWVGAQKVFARAYDTTGLDSSWVLASSWTIGAATPIITSVSPTNGQGTVAAFSIRVADGDGGSDVDRIDLSVGSSPAVEESCNASFYPITGTVSLQSGNSNWDSGTAGNSRLLTNTRCSLETAGVSFSSDGDTVLASLSLQFSSAWAGPKSVYAKASDRSSANSGWVKVGDWAVGDARPVVLSAAQTLGGAFIVRALDGNGPTDLRTIDLFLGASLSQGVDNCHLSYNISAGTVALRLEDGTWDSGVAGSSGVLANMRCAVDKAGVSRSIVNNILSARFSVQFIGPWSGTQNAYARAQDSKDLDSDWQVGGQWTIGRYPPTLLSITPAQNSSGATTLTVRAIDTDGPTDINRIDVFLGPELSYNAANCHVSYHLGTGKVSLRSDDGSWLHGVAGAAGALTNARCSVDTERVSLSEADNASISVSIPLQFVNSWTGLQNVYGRVYDRTGLDSTWFRTGTLETR